MTPPSACRFARRLILGLALLVSWHATGRCSDGSAPNSTTTDADEIQDLLFHSPKSPILIRLRIRIDGQGIHQLRREHAQQLLKLLDADKDGRLSSTEAAAIPPPAALVSPGEMPVVALKPTPVDADQDGDVTADELAAHLRVAAGAALNVVTAVQRPQTAAIELFKRLDRNEDDVLSPQELELAETRLRKMDVNDDERVQSDEIQPRIQVFSQQQPQSDDERAAAALALLDELPPEGGEERAARKLLQHYDKLARDPKTRRFLHDRHLTVEELGREPEYVAPYDANGDSRLSATELTEMLRHPTPDFEFRIDGSRAGESRFTVLKRPEHNRWQDEFDLRDADDGRVELHLAGVAFSCSSSFTQTETDYERQYRDRFSNADGDKNDYLGPQEFNRLGVSSDLFSRVDTDRNQMVFVDELTAYVRVQSIMDRSRVAMTAANNSQSLFDHVDRTSDQVLDDEELAGLAQRIREWDHDGDGSLASREFASSHRMVFSTGNRDPLQNGGAIQVDFISNVMRGPRNPADDEISVRWFTRMDRNQDGRVSQREFLGKVETFAELDRDRDGYLARNEAVAAAK